MTTISISQLKTNPSSAISQSIGEPLAVQNRNNTQAYLIGKDLFEKIMSSLEDLSDRQAINNTDFSQGEDFETVAAELGI